jgi:hypothetical protein
MDKQIPIKDLKKDSEYISDGIPTGVHSYIEGIQAFCVIRVTEKAIRIKCDDESSERWVLKGWGNINIIEEITHKWNYKEKE